MPASEPSKSVYRAPRLLLVAALATAGLAACDDDDSSAPGPGETGATTFEVRVENVSAAVGLPTPFAPGAWAVHTEAGVLFAEGEADRGEGLEMLAEDGDPSALAAALAAHGGVASAGAFNTPEGADAPGPLLPGQAYTFEIEAEPGQRLSFASMLVHSNDRFVGPGGEGVALFADDGSPREGVLVDAAVLWDAGTEADEPPAQGPTQAPAQAGAGVGRMEGVIGRRTAPTRALPLAAEIARVEVVAEGDELVFTLHNVASGTYVTPIAPVFFATHDDTWALFADGAPASGGLETLAEDGSPMALVGEHEGAAGVGRVGAQPVTDERPEADPGPAAPGERYTFRVTPDLEHPYLSFAAMAVQSNDAFLALDAAGVRLFDGDEPRPTDALEAEIAARLALWDAGTEANQTPGAGADQPLRQAGPNTGAPDPDSGVRLYRDAGNDLADIGQFADVVITPQAEGRFEVVVRNASMGTAYMGALTPVVHALHGGDGGLFEAGAPASEGLMRLAEDGDPMPLAGALGAMVAATPEGAEAAGPLHPGEAYRFTVTPTPEARFLSLASMVVPSNDTFVAFGPQGVALLDAAGAPRAADAIAADVASLLQAWDAGTELDQAGAAGADQAPHQAGPDTGAAEGDGTVRRVGDAWRVPMNLVRVTLVPKG